MRSYDWNEMTAHQQEGRLRRVIAGERMTVLRQVIPSGPDSLGAHSHPQEQISIVLEGRARFTCAASPTTSRPASGGHRGKREYSSVTQTGRKPRDE